MAMEPSDRYTQLKEFLIRTGQLYEDPEFPATGSSIGGPMAKDRNIKWLRPTELTDDPQFIVQGMTRHDIFQGKIRDCFLLAGAACISVTNPALLYRVIPPGQNFDMQYTGMFRFNFYRYDRWVEVIIDDRLPTISGKLIMSRNKNRGQKNEFWVALLEKAYAKLNGSYMNIDTGFVNEAIVDMTGGISEIVEVNRFRNKPESLFNLMIRTMDMSSFIGCAVNIEAQNLETALNNGLYSGHAYSITKLAKVPYKGKMTMLIRLRNPWGRKEWDGPWGDDSSRWRKVSDAVKQQLGYEDSNDGEFWMDFEDFMEEFMGLYFGHLTPDAFLDESSNNTALSGWEQQIFNGEWIPGQSAGGCGNHPYKHLFWTNPQYMMRLNPEDDADGDGRITTIIMLSQKYRTDETNDYLSFLVFQVNPSIMVRGAPRRFTENELIPIKRRKDFVNVRDVSDHFKFGPGNYVIVPCTFKPNKSGQFTLRIFTEAKVPPQQIAYTVQGM